MNQGGTHGSPDLYATGVDAQLQNSTPDRSQPVRRSWQPLAEDLFQIEVRRYQADVSMSVQHTHRAPRHPVGHVTRLRDRRNQAIVLRCEEQRRRSDLVEPFANVEPVQPSQPVDVAVAAAVGGQLDESPDVA
jgi:hypothetical protein